MQVLGRLFYGYYGIVRFPGLLRSAFQLRLVHQDRSYRVDTDRGLPG